MPTIYDTVQQRLQGLAELACDLDDCELRMLNQDLCELIDEYGG